MTEFLTEQPIVIEEGSRRALASQVATWISKQPIDAGARALRGYVAGIYGARGSGKTSFLFTLLEELRKRARPEESSLGQAPPAPPALALPTANIEFRSAIFKPSETRAQDGLLLMLLDHLSVQYPALPSEIPSSNDNPKHAIQRKEILNKEIKLFLDYAKETSPSIEKLETSYIKVLTEAATTSTEIKEKFKEFLQLRIPENGRLVLLVDDVDLQPHRALELLETIHLFLDIPRIFVILAADKPLLLHAIDQELHRRNSFGCGSFKARLTGAVSVT